MTIAFLPRWALEIALWLSYVVWRAFDFASRLLVTSPYSRLGCLSCLFALPLYLVYFANALLSAPFWILYMSIGRIDIALGNAGEPGISTRLDVARATFYWPSILLFWLMPKLYGVEIIVPPETTAGVSLVYVLRDPETGETALVQPGPKAVH
jgi:hypothetical protein